MSLPEAGYQALVSDDSAVDLHPPNFVNWLRDKRTAARPNIACSVEERGYN